MRNTKMKLFVYLLSIIIVYAVIPACPSYAAQSGVCGEHLTWYMDNSGKLTISGYGEMYDYGNAATVSWTRWSTYVSEVVISENVTSIGAFAFSGCSQMTKITIPDTVKTIGTFAFDYCQRLDEITIPNSVTSIGNYAFFECIDLDSIEIPGSVTSIGEGLFYECRDLRSVVIANGVKTIGTKAFYRTGYIDILNIPDSVTSIGEQAFSGSEVYNIIIPQSVTSIGENAFENCKYIKSLVIDKKVCGADILSAVDADKIHYYFDVTYANDGHGTVSGKTVTYGTDVLELTIRPENKYVLREVTMTDKNKSVRLTRDSSGKYIIPDADTSVVIRATFALPNQCGDDLTWTWNGNDTLTITGSGKMFDWENADDVPWKKHKTLVKKVILPDGITSIGDFAFYSCTNLTSVSLPDSITVIGNSAFGECTALTSINVPRDVTSIGDSAFDHCSKIAGFSLPEKLTYIGKFAFRNCTCFETLTIPDGVVSIGEGAFYACTIISSVTLPDNLEYIYTDAFKYCSSLTSVKIPYNTTLKGSPFYSCVRLNSVVINKEKFNKSAFELCNKAIFHYYYDVSYESDGNGTISGKSRSYGTDVGDFAVTSNNGYEIDTVSLNYSNKTVILTSNNSTYTYTMPDSDSAVTVRATFKKIKYSISVSDSENGNVAVSQNTAGIGDIVEIYIDPDPGYEPDSILVNDSPIDSTHFTMGVGNTTVKVLFKRIEYSIEVKNTINGTANVDKNKANAGDKITITVKPDKCYVLDTIKVNGVAIDGTEFTMPENNVILDVEFKAKPHDLEFVPGESPTCTEDGYEPYYKCRECGKLFSDSEGKNEILAPTAISKLNHSWDDGEVTKESTCEETGVKTFHCTHSDCLETKTESIKALGHKIIEVAEKAPTKIEPGNIKHYKCERCGKLFNDANGKNEITQSQAVIPAMGHYLTEVKAKGATCTESGNIAYYICKDDDCKCGKVYSDPYGQHEISIDDTVKPALGHSPEEVASKAATCTEDGYEKYFKCSRCHKLFSDAEGKNEIEKPVTVTKLGHDMTHVEAKKPTHEDDGHKEYYHCNRCGKNFADAEGNTLLTDVEIVVPAIGAAVLGEEAEVDGFKYKVTNPKTDGTGTVSFIGVDSPISAVAIPNTVVIKLETYKVTSIANNAFYGDKTIRSVYIGSNIAVIGGNAFFGCSNLVKVSGGARVKTIGTNAFARCSKLSTFVITSSVLAKISPNAFYKDSKLKTIYIKNTTKLTKSGVKKSLKGSSVKTVKVKKSKVKKYKKYFKKSNSGRTVKVKK